MRHEPYQAFQGEIYTTSRKGVYSLFQRRDGRPVRLTEETFPSQIEAKQWVEPLVEKYRIVGYRPFITNDSDD